MQPIVPASFETNHLRAERSILAHEPAIYAVMQTPEVMQAFQSPNMTHEFHLDRFTAALTEQWEKYGYGMYTLFDKQSNEIIGIAGFHCVTVDQKTNTIDAWQGQRESLEIYFALEPKNINNGYAQEIIHACANIAFENLPYTSVITYSEPTGNVLLTPFIQCGFTKENQAMKYKGDSVYIYRLKK